MYIKYSVSNLPVKLYCYVLRTQLIHCSSFFAGSQEVEFQEEWRFFKWFWFWGGNTCQKKGDVFVWKEKATSQKPSFRWLFRWGTSWQMEGKVLTKKESFARTEAYPMSSLRHHVSLAGDDEKSHFSFSCDEQRSDARRKDGGRAGTYISSMLEWAIA